MIASVMSSALDTPILGIKSKSQLLKFKTTTSLPLWATLGYLGVLLVNLHSPQFSPLLYSLIYSTVSSVGEVSDSQGEMCCELSCQVSVVGDLETECNYYV